MEKVMRVQFNEKSRRFELMDNGVLVKSYLGRKDLQNYIDDNGIIIETETQYTPTPSQELPKFSVNEKFKFVEQLSSMVIDKLANSMVISGQPGIGKSYGLNKVLVENGLIDGLDYITIKGGNITPRGLFEVLKENSNDKIIIIDDADSILSSQNSLMLKGALDSSKRRFINWVTVDGVEEIEFNSQVVILTNLPKNKIDSAVLSRSFYVNLQLTNTELISRMQFLLPSIESDLSLEAKQDCLNLLDKYKEVANEVNIRTLLKLFSIRKINDGMDNDWEKLATYSLLA